MSVLKIAEKVYIMGDPHIGRKFKNNVPLHRRGEREALLIDAFNKGISEVPGDSHLIIAGDLFDSINVSPDDILTVYRAVSSAKCSISILRGNHDLSRNSERESSFSLLSQICDLPNVRFINEVTPIKSGDYSLLMVPFDYAGFESTIEKASGEYNAIVTHEDEQILINNMTKITSLLKADGLVLNGHIHLTSCPHSKIFNVGSLMPLAFGEDSNPPEYFLTLSLEDYKKIDPKDIINKCVRVIVQEGETVPEEPDCLLWKIIVGEVSADTDINIESLDLDNLNVEELIRQEIPDVSLAQEVLEMYAIERDKEDDN